MFVRRVDDFHDVTKQLLFWIFGKKRKFSSGETKLRNFYKNEKYTSQRFRRFFPKTSGREALQDINWNEVTLKPVCKDFYVPQPEVLNRLPEELTKFWNENNIEIIGQNCPEPVFSFEEIGLPDVLLEELRRLNYNTPTPIQSQGLSIALSGRNMVGIGQTGSGKTLGFMLPGIVHVINQPKLEKGDGPVVLVVAPTRELVQQIHFVCKPFVRKLNLKSAAVYGGSNKISQLEKVQMAHICLATPGRLLDFLGSGDINLQRCTYLVLDEADRMFDMGFEPQIKDIFKSVRPDRQVLMWSATWPREIRHLAQYYLHDYVLLKVGSGELTVNPNIRQLFKNCRYREKKNVLLGIIKEIVQEEEHKTLIFTGTKIGAYKVQKFLKSNGFGCGCIHGDKSQSERDWVMQRFRTGEIQFLVATDVVSRGIDVTDVKYVINYDCPQNSESYIHRIGRTGRHNSKGTAYTFITGADERILPQLKKIAQSTKNKISDDLVEADEEDTFPHDSKKFAESQQKYYRRSTPTT